MALKLHNQNNSLSRRSARHINSEINVTPFVDVMLVLLVIFMVTSPMLVSGVQVELPKTRTAPLAGQDEPLAISIDRQGQVYIQDTHIELTELPIKLKAILAEKYDTRIFIRGDQGINYGRVMNVFGALREAGYTNVALVTEVATGK